MSFHLCGQLLGNRFLDIDEFCKLCSNNKFHRIINKVLIQWILSCFFCGLFIYYILYMHCLEGSVFHVGWINSIAYRCNETPNDLVSDNIFLCPLSLFFFFLLLHFLLSLEFLLVHPMIISLQLTIPIQWNGFANKLHLIVHFQMTQNQMAGGFLFERKWWWIWGFSFEGFYSPSLYQETSKTYRLKS